MEISFLLAIIAPFLRYSSAISAFNEISKYPRYVSKVEKVFTPVVSMTTVVKEVDERFLSVALESEIVRRWRDFDTSNTTLRTLCSALSPAYLRVGGTSADFLIFKPNEKSPPSYNGPHFEDSYQDGNFAGKHYDNFTMNAKSWDNLNTFARQSGWELLFDLNVLLRKTDSTWDPKNATRLLEYSIQKNYSRNLHFELGNEPDAFKHSVNRSLSAEQLGEDFLTLRSLVKEDPRFAQHFAHSLLVGPDVTRPKKKSLKYLTGFLQVVQQKVDRVTFHQYYCNGRNTSLQEFLDPRTLSLLPKQISLLQDALKSFGDLKLWLGETSSCYGGGAPVLSESFVAGFLWADKLGVSALRGIQVVIRQSLFSGHYSLITNDYKPNPDYWLSLLYKSLMGTKVLHVSGSTSRVRMYAHCTFFTSQKSPQLATKYGKGSVTLMILNLRNHTSKINIDTEKHVYWLTAHGHKGLVSRLVDLNGKKLKMADTHTLPLFHPREVRSKTVSLPAHSLGFIVLPGANASACLE